MRKPRGSLYATESWRGRLRSTRVPPATIAAKANIAVAPTPASPQSKPSLTVETGAELGELCGVYGAIESSDEYP